MKTLDKIERAIEELSPAAKTELLLFVAKSLRSEQAPLPEPRLLSAEQVKAWMDEDEEAMRRFRSGTNQFSPRSRGTSASVETTT